MGNMRTVSAKIPEELCGRLSRHNVNLSKLVRELLEREVDRLDEEERSRLFTEAGEILRKIPEERLVEDVRWSRDRR